MGWLCGEERLDGDQCGVWSREGAVYGHKVGCVVYELEVRGSRSGAGAVCLGWAEVLCSMIAELLQRD